MTDQAALPALGNADHHLLLKLTTTAGLAGIADFLFYDQRLGLSVALFAVTLISGTLATNRVPSDRRRVVRAGLILIAGIIPVVEELNALSFLMLALAIITGIVLLTHPDDIGPRVPLSALRQLLLIGPFRLIPDAATALRGSALTRGLVVWFVPLAFGSLFVLLFAQANPLIEQWFDAIRPGNVETQFDWPRALFWLAALSLIWPFIYVRWRHKKARGAAADPLATAQPELDAPPSGLDHLLSPPTILRSLILFNLLFAVQTTLDIAYLWGHLALPAGISYADYAHRGAYPLIVTALLSAGFVLAIRPGAGVETKFVRSLLYLWVGQNVTLVLSSILRLKLYVAVYLLTYWRVAAGIWMGLIAFGLILMVARIALGRSHRWLIRMNLFAALATLYVCSLTNFDAIIADYNVTHSQEAGRRGVAIDGAYLASLGPQALPAIEKALELGISYAPYLRSRQDDLIQTQQNDMASWRSWSFRKLRLQHYLNTHPASSGAG